MDGTVRKAGYATCQLNHNDGRLLCAVNPFLSDDTVLGGIEVLVNMNIHMHTCVNRNIDVRHIHSSTRHALQVDGPQGRDEV